MYVSDACQINDFDHRRRSASTTASVSDACQINDFDHQNARRSLHEYVSDACQINDFDHTLIKVRTQTKGFRCLSDQ